MQAKSIKGKSTAEIKKALSDSMEDAFKPTLAIVFMSISQDRKVVCELLTNAGLDVFGATSCGEFTEGYQAEGSIVVLLLDIPKNYYAFLFEEIGDSNLSEVGHRIAQEAEKKFTHPSMILCSTGINSKAELFNGTQLVQSVKEKLSSNIAFFGGMAGDDMTFSGSYIFTKEKETDCGVAAIVFDAEKVNMFGMAITGWKPMGIMRTITKSEGKKIYTIDNLSAVDMYFKYLGREEKRTDQSFRVFEELGFTYPFITEREPGGDLILKTPVQINHEENALVMDIEMEEGTKFWFSMPPDFDIVDEILDEATQLKNANQSEADALLIFSCAGRQPVLGPLVTAENDGLANLLNTPMAGFFTYGEYGRTKKGKQEYHSGACCWVAFKEK
ncbi:MAG: FIST N-terminal domain-containing protein [Chitinophagaceae bacterium]